VGSTVGLKPWTKGQSGNPSGRPAVVKDFRDRCREFMDKDGWRALFAMVHEGGPNAYQALALIAAYAYGKPSQPITGEDGGPIQFAITALVADIHREAEKAITERARLLALADGDDESAEAENAAGPVVYVVDSGGPRLGQDEDGG
jgi:hypothetical protein